MTLNCSHPNATQLMQFQLPSNLQQHLVKYDPELKKIIPPSKPKVSRNTLGLPDDMIPAHIIKKEVLSQILININAEPVEERYHIFKKDITGTKAVIYHIENLWVAAWLPNPGEDYVYGISFACKANAFNKINIPFGSGERLFNIDTVTSKKYGRTDFYTWTDYITIDHIKNGLTNPYWLHNTTRYKQKLQEIKRHLTSFTAQIKQSIPHWKEDGIHNIFDRLHPIRNSYTHILRIPEEYPSVPGIELYKMYLDENNRHVLDTPWFKRYINTEAQKIITAFHDPTTASPNVLLDIHNEVKHTLAWITRILKIWSDCPIDYLQTAIANNTFALLTQHSLYWAVDSYDALNTWLNTYLPVESFFKILTKYTDELKTRPTGRSTKHTFQLLADTITMLDQILTAGETIDPPKRWRIEEFHDHIQVKAWTIKNPNQNLPQDLFPTPIKVLDKDQTWTFIQPIDTHQLSQWGQAVRNCVGAASSYANAVKTKKAFIVLCLCNNRPQFTVMLKVSNGVMHVDQIVGLSNARLNDAERNIYEDKFSRALQLREEELRLGN
mgnify:CR=1 FL=1